MDSKLLIFSAPSGAGKTTIVCHLLKKFPILEFSISATSRNPRQGEQNGKDYYFLSIDEFKAKIEQGEFVEWEEVYPGLFYGTLRSELERIWNKGNVVLFDVDVKGGLNLKAAFPESSLAVFVKPPSVEELRARLERRGTETPESIETRISKAREEMAYAERFDRILVNRQVETAFFEAEQLVSDFLAR